jgi:hypothetical protein
MSWTRGSAAWVISIVGLSTALYGCGSSGRGDTTSTGGSSAGGQNTGGSGVVGGSTASGGSGTSGAGGAAPEVCPTIDYGACTPAVRTSTEALVYEGASNAGVCASSIADPRIGTWFKYNDGTTAATQTGATELNGHAGADDCAFHSTGMGFNNWGAGFGFSVNNLGGTLDCPENDSAYTGLHVYVKGTADATRTQPNYASSPNTIHIKLITTTCRDNDDFGAFCVLDADPTAWTLCDVPFASVIREGFRDSTYPVAGDTFDPANLIKVQMQLDKFGTATDPAVNYDVWIDDISFY